MCFPLIDYETAFDNVRIILNRKNVDRLGIWAVARFDVVICQETNMIL